MQRSWGSKEAKESLYDWNVMCEEASSSNLGCRYRQGPDLDKPCRPQ